jgi:hypothetical protein
VRTLSRERQALEGGDLTWLDALAGEVIQSAGSAERSLAGISAHFFDDLQTLSRLAEQNNLRPTLLAYAQINLFTIRFDLNWLVVADAP